MYDDENGTWENSNFHADDDNDLETLGQNESFEHSISEREAEGIRDEYNEEHEDMNEVEAGGAEHDASDAGDD